MISQTTLPFKLELSKKELTSRSGLSCVAEFHKSIGLSSLVNKHLPAPGSHRGFSPSVFVESLSLMLESGGRRLEDLRELSYEPGLMKILEHSIVPSSDAMGDWLRRMGKEQEGGSGLLGMQKVHKEVIKRLMRHDGHSSYTLDMDASIIEADKYESAWTYKDCRGYMPIVGFLAENRLCLHHEFRNGNVPPCASQKGFYLASKAAMPFGKKISYVRVDGAGYQGELINSLEEDGVKYVIRAHRCLRLRKILDSLPDCRWEKSGSDHNRYETTDMRHTIDTTDKVFRMVIKRERIHQLDLFDGEKYIYRCLATNFDESEKSNEEVIRWYNQRGESENMIKELKGGFGMESMPCGQNHANAMFLSVGVLAYNLFEGFKRLSCPRAWLHHKVSTLRWKLINIAGQIVYHGRQVILKLQADKELLDIFERIRSKIYEFSLSCG